VYKRQLEHRPLGVVRCPDGNAFAASQAGVILVTVNPAYRESELRYVLQQSRSAGLFVAREFRGNPMLAVAQAVRAECSELREIICFDDWDTVLAETPADTELPAVAADDPVMIQYTSGTTGFPKGALLSNRGLANNGSHTADRMGVREGAVVINYMPLFHTGGCVCVTLGAISTASTMVLLEAFDPGLALELIDTFGVNSMLGVPTMLVALMEHPAFSTTDTSHLAAINSGGSPVPAPLVRRP